MKATLVPSSQVMSEFKAGTLNSGSPSGPKVTNPKQAVAILVSEKSKENKTTGTKRGAKRTAKFASMGTKKL